MEHQPTSKWWIWMESRRRRVRALARPKTSVLFLLAGQGQFTESPFQTPTQSPFLDEKWARPYVYQKYSPYINLALTTRTSYLQIGLTARTRLLIFYDLIKLSSGYLFFKWLELLSTTILAPSCAMCLFYSSGIPLNNSSFQVRQFEDLLSQPICILIL